MPIPKNTDAPDRMFNRGDHIELAERVLEVFKKRGPVVRSIEGFHNYDPATGVWVRIDEATIRGTLHQFAGLPKKIGKKRGILKLNRVDSAGAAKCMLDDLSLVDLEFFTKDNVTPGLAFQNKFVKFAKGKAVAVDHSPDHRCRFGVPHEWKAKPQFNNWRAFLYSIFKEDEDEEVKRAFLQEFIGVCLAGVAPTYAIVPLLVGEGANGKGVFTELVSKMLPGGLVAAIPPSKWGEDYHVADLEDALLNVETETPTNAVLESSYFKKVIVGDPITGRKIRESPRKFYPRAGHLFSVQINELPAVKDHSDGFWRRWVCIGFNQQFSPKDKGFKPRDVLMAGLMKDVGGILCWAMHGAARLIERGHFIAPITSKDLIEQWREQTDSVAAWRAECETKIVGERGADQWTLATPLYRTYKAFCQKNGRKNPVSSTTFGVRLRALGIAKRRGTKGVEWAIVAKAPTGIVVKGSSRDLSNLTVVK